MFDTSGRPHRETSRKVLDEFQRAIPRTKAGEVKRRFSWDEKMRMLDPRSAPEKTRHLLYKFVDLFAPHRDNWILSKGHGPRKWTTVKTHPLPLTEVVWHLLGDRIETRPVRWVGARPAGGVAVATIDVDADAEIPRWPTPQQLRQTEKACRNPTFGERCRQVEDALRSVAINPDDPDQVLIVRTPRGGRHYHFFFDGKHFDYQFSNLWNLLGLAHRKGCIELYPRQGQGVRLPFGHIPGSSDPTAWLHFMQRYTTGRIHRHNLGALLESAARIAAPRPQPRSQALKSAPQSPSSQPATTPRSQGIPKARRSFRDAGTDELSWYDRVIADERIHSQEDARRLIAMGIRREGTRTAALKLYAQHLIWFQGCTAEEAEAEMTQWAMNPRHESKDIWEALRGGKDEVTPQISRMCQWYAEHQHGYQPGTPHSKFYAPEELSVFRTHLVRLPTRQRRHQARFYLEMLGFVKRYGRPLEDGTGWKGCVAATVMRTWPGCSGKRDKVRRDAALMAGLLVKGARPIRTLTRSGRAQEYKLIVPVIDRSRCTIGHAAALKALIAVPTEAELTAHVRIPAQEHPLDDDDSPTGDNTRGQRSDTAAVPASDPGIDLGTSPRERDHQRVTAAGVSDAGNGRVPADPPRPDTRNDVTSQHCSEAGPNEDLMTLHLKRRKEEEPVLIRYLLRRFQLPEEARAVLGGDTEGLTVEQTQLRNRLLDLARHDRVGQVPRPETAIFGILHPNARGRGRPTYLRARMNTLRAPLGAGQGQGGENALKAGRKGSTRPAAVPI